MLSAALPIFFLRELPFERYAFPRWQTALAITAIGLLAGWDASVQADPDMPEMSLWVSLGMATIVLWLAFLTSVFVLRVWMKRGGRWDGQGELANLVAASWLTVDALGIGLGMLGVPDLLLLPLWLYSFWVSGNALSGAIPKASLGYAIAGVLISLVAALIIIALPIAAFVFVIAIAG